CFSFFRAGDGMRAFRVTGVQTCALPISVIGRLAQHAREQSAATILLAGDVFDTETPASDVRRQALTEMAHHAPIRWVILPGNHDSLQATQLWTTLGAEAPDNIILAVEPRPIELAA